MRKTVFICLALFLLLLGATASKGRLPGYFIADEAAYYMMTESLARDGDLRFTPQDLERTWQDWSNGPEGLILKTTDGGRTVWYGKPYLYPLLAVPFYLLLGARGFVFLNLLLLLIMSGLGYRYLARGADSESSRNHALIFALTFFLLSAAFSYAFWIQPEVFAIFLVFCGCYFAFPPVSPITGMSTGAGDKTSSNPLWRIALAAVFLVLAASLKPVSILFLPLLLAGMRPLRPGGMRKLLVAAVFVLLAAGVYHGFSSLAAGGWSPYRGDRRSFNHQSGYPGQRPAEELWTRASENGKSGSYQGWGLAGRKAVYHLYPSKLFYNSVYFLVGRHTGIFVYFFPCLVCLAGLLAERRWRDPWRIWLLLAIAGHTLFFFILLPHNWQGGGGFIGNRYFVFSYPAFFFLRRLPPGRGWLAASWVVAGLFLSQLIFTPFGAVTERPTLQAHTRNPIFRLLPYEVTLRYIPGYLVYMHGGTHVRLMDGNVYFENAASGFWVRGESTTRVLYASPLPLERMIFRVSDPEVEISGGWACGSTVLEDPELNPDHDPHLRQFQPRGTLTKVPLAFRDEPYWFYTLAFRTRKGTLPWIEDPESWDKRYLGCRVEYLGNGAREDNPWLYRGSVTLEEDAPARMAAEGAGGLLSLPVRVVNGSPYRWQEGDEHPVQLSYHWFDTATGERVVWDGLRTPLRDLGASGQSTELAMVVRLPDAPGDYLFQPDMVCPGIDWFSTHAQDRFPRIQVTVAAPLPGAGQEWRNEEHFRAVGTNLKLPSSFPAGGESGVTVTLENRGTATWSTAGLPSVRLSYHWLDLDGRAVIHNGLHTALPSPIGPGEAADVLMRIGCPSEPGRYILELDLLCEGINWFAAVNGVPLQRVEVEVS
jgi:hypothetical protein